MRDLFIVVTWITLSFLFNCPFTGHNQNSSCIVQKNEKQIQKNIIDYNGDGISDISVFSIKDRTLYIKDLPDHKWEVRFEIPLPLVCDFNGDTKTDIAFYDNGFWHIYGILLSKIGSKGDIPVPGDYDGDGKIDLAVWRPSTGIWLFSTRDDRISWGESQDIPVPLDYDGDSKTDIAVWRPSDGNWYIKFSSGKPFVTHWGTHGDIPVPGDYNGDGKANLAVWRPSNGYWYIKGLGAFQCGAKGDIPVPGDYDGSGTTDIAIWNSSESIWILKNHKSVKFGRPSDIPITWNIWVLWKKKLFKEIKE